LRARDDNVARRPDQLILACIARRCSRA
jgi:hypothetical protein